MEKKLTVKNISNSRAGVLYGNRELSVKPGESISVPENVAHALHHSEFIGAGRKKSRIFEVCGEDGKPWPIDNPTPWEKPEPKPKPAPKEKPKPEPEPEPEPKEKKEKEKEPK